MKLRSSYHYLIRKKRVWLTAIALEIFKNIKITGSKIALFFDLEEDEQSIGKPITPFQIWKKVIGWGNKTKNPKEEEKNREKEKIIMDYLNKKTNRNWKPYPLGTHDAFYSIETLGGVPDGVEKSEGGKFFSILEIKTKFIKEETIEQEIFNNFPIKYLLQLAFYLYLSYLDEGYLAICSLRKRNAEISEEISLTSDLKRLSFYEQNWCFKKLPSYIPEIGICEFFYKILEVYKNTGAHDNELLFIKFKFDIKKYENSILKIKDWFEKHRRVSPEMSDRELREILCRKRNR